MKLPCQMISVGTIAAALLFGGCSSTDKTDKTIVTLGKDKLGGKILEQRVPQEFRGVIEKKQWLDFVNGWVESQLLATEAEKLGALSDPRVKMRLEEAKQQILIEFLRENVIAPSITITDEDIEKYFFANQADFVRETDEIHALHIVVNNSAAADSIKRFLNADSSFNSIAKRYSLEYSITDSCDIGWFSKNDIVPEFSAQVFKAKPGEFVGPLSFGGKFHFFFIADYEAEGSVSPIEIVSEQVRRIVFQTKFNERIHAVADSLRTEATIKIDTAAIDSIVSANKIASFRKSHMQDDANSDTTTLKPSEQ